jgi:energy-coupling factor transport system permease protein
MSGAVSLGRYYPASSLLHRLDPRTKILSAILLMVVIFLTRDLVPMLLLGGLTLGLIGLSRVPVREVLLSLRPMLFILLFAVVINMLTIGGDPLLQLGPVVVSRQGVVTAARMGGRLVLLILNTTLLLTLTTTPIHIADALENLLGPLRKIGFPAHEMAMMMSIALRFVPTLLDETDIIMKAQSSRGADYDTGGPISRARGLVSVLIPLFVSAFKRAEDLAVAMEARCYRGGEQRTRLRQMQYQRRDVIFGGCLALAMALILGCRLVA